MAKNYNLVREAIISDKLSVRDLLTTIVAFYRSDTRDEEIIPSKLRALGCSEKK